MDVQRTRRLDREDFDNDSLLTDAERRAATIDQLAIKSEFVALPAEMAVWGARYASALRDSLMAEAEYDRAEAQCAMNNRIDLAESGLKVTENAIKERVAVDEALFQRKVAMVAAQAYMQRLRQIVNALAAKRDALISLGAHIREEKRSLDMHINEEPGGPRRSRLNDDIGNTGSSNPEEE